MLKGDLLNETISLSLTDLHNTLPDVWTETSSRQVTNNMCLVSYVLCMSPSISLSVCVCVPLTSIVLIEGVHAGEVDGEGLEGRRQADAALRSFHVEARRRPRVGRLGQARLGILHAEYGSRRLGWLSAAPHGRSTSPRKVESSKNPPRGDRTGSGRCKNLLAASGSRKDFVRQNTSSNGANTSL